MSVHSRMLADRRHQGMTLVEVLLTLSIFIIIVVAVGTFQVNVFSYHKAVYGSLQTSQDAQIILKTILREVRSMSPGATGQYPISVAATNTLTFFSDLDGNNVQDQITYSLIGNTIYRARIVPSGSPATYLAANQGTTTLVTNIRNSSSTPVFEYYDDTFTGTSTPLSQPVTVTAVKLIKVNLTLDVDPNRSPLPIMYSADVNLRNLKTNL